jgi:hypothetical protein
MPLWRWQVSRPQVRKSHAQKSELDGAENSLQPELRFLRLENIPIEDARHEKGILEKGGFERNLNPEFFSGPVVVSDEVRRGRIVEVYRLCFEQADPRKRLKVVRDFIAHFPRLVFDADWLKELVSLADDGNNEVLRAVATGFRSATRRTSRLPAVQRFYKVSGARMAVRTIQAELSAWDVGLERSVCPPEDIPSLVVEKAGKLAKTYRLGQRDKQRLTKLLEQGHCYQAAVLIASRAFSVRERDLQEKSD